MRRGASGRIAVTLLALWGMSTATHAATHYYPGTDFSLPILYDSWYLSDIHGLLDPDITKTVESLLDDQWPEDVAKVLGYKNGVYVIPIGIQTGCNVTNASDPKDELKPGTLRHAVQEALAGKCRVSYQIGYLKPPTDLPPDHGGGGGATSVDHAQRWCYIVGAPAKAAKTDLEKQYASKCVGSLTHTMHIVKIPQGMVVQLQRPLVIERPPILWWKPDTGRRIVAILGGQAVPEVSQATATGNYDGNLQIGTQWFSALRYAGGSDIPKFIAKDAAGTNTRALLHVARDPHTIVHVARLEFREAPFEALQVMDDHGVYEHLRFRNYAQLQKVAQQVWVEKDGKKVLWPADKNGNPYLAGLPYAEHTPAVRLYGAGNLLQHLFFDVAGYPLQGHTQLTDWQQPTTLVLFEEYVIAMVKALQQLYGGSMNPDTPVKIDSYASSLPLTPVWGNYVEDLKDVHSTGLLYPVSGNQAYAQPTLTEIDIVDEADWEFGGFPEPKNAKEAQQKHEWLSQFIYGGWDKVGVSVRHQRVPGTTTVVIYKLHREDYSDYPNGKNGLQGIVDMLIPFQSWTVNDPWGPAGLFPGDYSASDFSCYLKDESCGLVAAEFSLELTPPFVGYTKPNSQYFVDETQLTRNDIIVVGVHHQVPVMQNGTFVGDMIVPVSRYSDPIPLTLPDKDGDGLDQFCEERLGLSDAHPDDTSTIDLMNCAPKDAGGEGGTGDDDDDPRVDRGGGAGSEGTEGGDEDNSWEGDGAGDGGQGGTGRGRNDDGGSAEGGSGSGRDGGGGEGEDGARDGGRGGSDGGTRRNPCTIGYIYDATKSDCVCDIAKGWSYNPTYDECLCKGKILPDGSCKK